MHSHLRILFVLLLSLVSCTHSTKEPSMNPPSDDLEKNLTGELVQEKTEASASEITPPTVDVKEGMKDNKIKEDIQHVMTRADWLQGKWQHQYDKTNILVFDGKLRKETAGSGENWRNQPYVLADQCLNVGNADSTSATEKDAYISCKGSDICWYIVEVNAERLELSYMGRGNTLVYYRMID